MADVLVVHGFPYSPDGISVVLLVAGNRADIRDELIPGLAASGVIDPGDWSPTPVAPPTASSGPMQVTPMATSSATDGAVLAAKPAQRRR
jgi:hypothetical protein